MERGMILLIAALVVYVAPDVQGSNHLSFSNATVNITRDGCGVSKLCVSQADNCDPSASGTCLFASVIASTPVAPNGTTLSIQLRGDSTGYVALGLTANASMGTSMLFLCIRNSSDNTFFFRTRQRNNVNNTLTATERRVTEIRGKVDGGVIRCEFMVPNANASSTRSPYTTYTILLLNGTYTPGALGPPTVLLNTGPLNVANPAANVPTTTAPPTTMSNTTMSMSNTTTSNSTMSSAGAVQPHAVLSVLSIFTLFGMLRA